MISRLKNKLSLSKSYFFLLYFIFYAFFFSTLYLVLDEFFLRHYWNLEDG